VTECLAGVSEVDRDLVALLVSELATNAIIHVGQPFDVWVSVTPRRARIGVDDRSPVLPSLTPTSQETLGGRGLSLVASLAKRWRVEPTGLGKTIWFEPQI
jgi:anti-sigma regulatory factor (Ser/Thr protein kinase)